MATALVDFKTRREEVIKKLRQIQLPVDGSATTLCWTVASALNISGPTVKNYLQGDVKDGYLAEAILKEFKNLKQSKIIKG